MRPKWNDLLSLHGALDRGPYFVWGAILFTIKFNLNKYLFIYWGKKLDSLVVIPGSGSLAGQLAAFSPTNLSNEQALILAISSLPFLWFGVILTIKRLRSIQAPPWIATIFFFPFLNYLFFLILCLAPARSDQTVSQEGSLTFAQRIVPKHPWGTSVMAIGITVVVGLLLVFVSTNVYQNYGGGLFLGTPFLIGLIAVLLTSVHYSLSYWQCVRTGITATVCLGTMLLALGIEGVVCIVMAAPIALILSIMGASLGYFLQQNRAIPNQSPVYVTLLPFWLLFNIAQEPVNESPTVFETSTTIEIQASPEEVWKFVVAFPDLPPPQSWLFYTGIAYPVGAHIDREGVGAIRHCRFSTGAFEEPITVWEPPRLLKFGVTASPPPLQEWSIYRTIHPPHLDNFFESKQGQFLLTPTGQGTTILTGTTWYIHRIGPAWYWRVFSDYIVHQIHLRVLRHIQARASANQG